MKKIIILLLVILLCGCSAEKPVETLSSMQTESAETTVTETVAPEKTTETTPVKAETVIETQKSETIVPSDTEQPEQKSTLGATTATTAEIPIEPATIETTTEPQATPITPAKTVKEEEPTELSEAVEAPPESATEPLKTEFDVNHWINFARSYALQIGLEIDETAVDCWDNPTTANADCICLERDLAHRLNRYAGDDDITAVNIWAESLGNGNYLIYIAYA